LKKLLAITLALVLAPLVLTAGNRAASNNEPTRPFTLLQLEGGRRLEFIRAFSSEKEINPKRSFWNKLVDFVAGEPEWHQLVRPYGVVTDSRGRIIISDPGALGVHIFGFEKKEYRFLGGSKQQTFQSPIGVAVDAQDNIYVADSRLGKIFVFRPDGKFLRYVGDIRGEGFFKRPTGLAIDKAEQRLYVTDTLRHKIYVTTLEGTVLGSFGGPGNAAGQFNFPTEVVVHGEELLVVDAMNFRVQVLDHKGNPRGQFGTAGDAVGSIFRPKGLSLDSNGNIFVVDAALEAVQVFNRQGRLLFAFGRSGTAPGQFELPSGLCIDGQNRIFVADSYNHRVQEFRFSVVARASEGQRP